MKYTLKQAVRRMGMSTGGMAAKVWQYPLPSGQGGIGHTVYLPFAEDHREKLTVWQRLRFWLVARLLGRQRFASLVFQPLVESFIVADDYPELNKTYILAASCLPFNEQAVTGYLTRRVGPLLNLRSMEL
jgi:hypothetical protein